MNPYRVFWCATLFSLPAVTMAFPDGKPDRSHINYYPRYTATECPPEYTSTRNAVVRYLKGESYCQVWCIAVDSSSGSFPADLSFIDTVNELHAGNDVGELIEAS